MMENILTFCASYGVHSVRGHRDSKSLLERMKKDGVEYVDLEFVDIFVP